jgi:hypothetical protein
VLNSGGGYRSTYLLLSGRRILGQTVHLVALVGDLLVRVPVAAGLDGAARSVGLLRLYCACVVCIVDKRVRVVRQVCVARSYGKGRKRE